MLSYYFYSIAFFFMKTSQKKSNFLFTKVHIATSKVHNLFNLRG
jgi:hypothetical protein